MLKLVDKKENEITMGELVDKFNKNKITVLMITAGGGYHKLTRIDAKKKGYAFVSLWGHRWANGTHRSIEKAIGYGCLNDNHILIFDSLTKYVNFLEKPHLVTKGGVVPVEEFRVDRFLDGGRRAQYNTEITVKDEIETKSGVVLILKGSSRRLYGLECMGVCCETGLWRYGTNEELDASE